MTQEGNSDLILDRAALDYLIVDDQQACGITARHNVLFVYAKRRHVLRMLRHRVFLRWVRAVCQRSLLLGGVELSEAHFFREMKSKSSVYSLVKASTGMFQV